MSSHSIFDYWLAAITDLPGHYKIKIKKHFPDLEEFCSLSSDEISRIPWITDPQKTMINRAKPVSCLQREYEQMESLGVRMITWQDPEYPQILDTVHDQPFAVFVKGTLPPAERKTVSVVGARACSPYGKKQTRELTKNLVSAGFSIVSGMASGVDGLAQQTALDSGGYSLAVLGCGANICYPKHHKVLYDKLTEHGGILSEYPLYEQPVKYHFPQRNRLISALSDAVIVIEAREKSGSLITADFALEQGRDIYALPGPVDSPLSCGCHRLIAQGARIILSPEQLIRDLGGTAGITKTAVETGDIPGDLSETEESVYRYLSFTPVKLSELELMTGMDTSLVARTLMGLQLRGLVSELSRQCYIRA